MSLWQKVQRLDPSATKEIVDVYSANNIPIELRDIFALWIETSLPNSQFNEFCSGLRLQIAEKLRSSAYNPNVPFYTRGKLTEFLDYLSNSDHFTLQGFHKRFQSCLEREDVLVNRGTGTNAPTKNPASADANYAFIPLTTSASVQEQNVSSNENAEAFEPDEFLNNPLRIIVDGEINRIEEAVWSLEESSNNLSIKCHELKRLQELRNQFNQANGHQPLTSQMQELQPQMYEIIKIEIPQMANQICVNTIEVRNCTLSVIQNWSHLKADLDNDISSWTFQQKMHANGSPLTMNINRIQYVSEYLMEVAWKLRRLLLVTDKVRLANPALFVDNVMRDGSLQIPQQLSTMTLLMKTLVQDTFLVIHQPCQVLKTNTRFPVLQGSNPMEIGLLVGEKLSLQLSPPSVAVCLVDEATCMDIQTKGLDAMSFNKVTKRGRLIPENARFEHCQVKKCTSASFRQISLKDFHRSGRKTAPGKEQQELQLVTEEKFALLFRSVFTIGDIEFRIWRLSLPLVIRTHGSQKSLAWAAVSWDNAFSQMNRIPFHLPDYVSWEGVREMLNGRFTAMVGASLSAENLNYFSNRLSDCSGFPNQLTWSELCKNNITGKKFSFWEWFYEGAKLIEDHLKLAWKDGFIKGFIGKESSENMLCRSGCPPGTFFLRFSESILGGLSIVWLHSDGTAYSLTPFRSKDLATQPFVEILDQETLHYVYPKTRKEDAFKAYFDEYESSNVTDRPKGENNKFSYIEVKTKLVIVNCKIPKFRLKVEDSESGQQSSDYETISPQPMNSEEPPFSQNGEDSWTLLDLNTLLNNDAMEVCPSTPFQNPCTITSQSSSNSSSQCDSGIQQNNNLTRNFTDNGHVMIPGVNCQPVFYYSM